MLKKLEINNFQCIWCWGDHSIWSTDIYNFVLSIFVSLPLWWPCDIIVQLQQVRVEAVDASKRLKELQSELVATKERCSQQAEDLNRKSGTEAVAELTMIRQ